MYVYACVSVFQTKELLYVIVSDTTEWKKNF